MREYDHQTHDGPHGAHDRQEQLVAAAEALRAWVYEQRETWESLPPVSVVEKAIPPVSTHSEPAQSSWRASLSVFSRLGETEAEVVEVAEVALSQAEAPVPVARPETLRPGLLNLHSSASESAAATVEADTSFVDSLRERVSQWKRQVAVAAVVALVAVGGWNVRAYWLNRPPAPARMGKAVLESVPPGLEVRVDGVVAGKTPLTKELKAGRHTVEFWRRNSSRRLEIEIKAGKSTVERLDWAAKRKGSLEVLSDPEGATVIVDGTSRGVTPLTIDDLSIGSHSVVLESAAGSLKRTVEVAPDRVAQVTEAIYSGWLHVSSPIELQVSEKTRRLLLDDRNQILLPPGPHSLRFENARLGYQETRTIEIKPGAITSISIAPEPSLLTVNASLPAEVLVDGQRVGDTPLLDHPIPLGTHVVAVRSITGAERRSTITVTGKPVQLDIDFSRP